MNNFIKNHLRNSAGDGQQKSLQCPGLPELERQKAEGAKKIPAVVWARPGSPESGKGSVAFRQTPSIPFRFTPGSVCLTNEMYDSKRRGANGKRGQGSGDEMPNFDCRMPNEATYSAIGIQQSAFS
jgi:hypothetical protein